MTAELILSLFKGRPNFVAVADDGKTFRPEPLEQPLRPAWLKKEHLGGKRCLGFYLLTEDNCVHCSAVDFDNKPDNPDPAWQDKAEQVYYFLANAGLDPLVEISASGQAAHVWLFFSEPVPSWLVRQFWDGVSRKLDVPMPEVYPRQDRLTGKGLGNLIRYPLWNLSRIVDVEHDWREWEPAEALSETRKTDAGSLKLVAWELGFGELREPSNAADDEGPLPARVRSKIERSSGLLHKRWYGDMTGLQDQSRSALVQSIACELVRQYVPTPEIEAAIRYWCGFHGYEKGERDGWVSETVRKAYDFVLERQEQHTVTATTIVDAAMAYLDQLQAGVQRHIKSGVHALDMSIDGVARGEMAVIAARPGHGKSAFGMQWIDEACASGIPCLVISEEMAAIELGRRALLSVSELEERDWLEHREVVRGEMHDHHEGRKPVYLVESCGTIDRAVELIDQYVSIYDVGLVAVDYLQLLGGRSGRRYEDVTEISRSLKQAAARNKCALLALCQLSREIEKRDKQVPKNSDLRESGQIEQDADLILFLQWPLKFNPEYERPEDYLIYATKRRNGPIRSTCITTKFNPARQRVEWDTSGEFLDEYQYKG